MAKKLISLVGFIGFIVFIIGICSMDSENKMFPAIMIVLGGITLYMCAKEDEKWTE